MKKQITVLPGDGIGPEVTEQAVKVLLAVGSRFGHEFKLRYADFGAVAIDACGEPAPAETVEACLRSDAVLLGAVGDPKYDSNPNATVRPEQGLLKLRKTLDVFANIRPVQTFKSLLDRTPLKPELLAGVDMVIYRELTGGAYFGAKERSVDNSWASDECRYSNEEISRIAHLAFKAARLRRRKLTLIDKANVLETSRLWRRVVAEISLGYPDVAVDYMFVDNAAMQLILQPSRFDVILTENMFGDILSDEASVLCGSIGMLASASVGAAHALFEPIHGSYPQAAGHNIANPCGAILSVAMMLEYFGFQEESRVVRQAVDWSLQTGLRTSDISPDFYYGTTEVGDLIRDYILESSGDANASVYNTALGQSTII
jgi:3-isopropylmalate dehydrogenase